MYVYGEPAAQTVIDRWGGTGYLWHLMLTQQGYIVMSLDNRVLRLRGAEPGVRVSIGRLESSLQEIRPKRFSNWSISRLSSIRRELASGVGAVVDR